MKVSEIILEAPQNPQVPNFGTAGQNYNVNYNLNTGGKSGAGATQFSVGSKGLMANVNGKPTSMSPADALKKFSAKSAATAKGISGKIWNKFTGNKIFRMFGNKYLGPFLIWLDDMSAVNEMFEAGLLNDHGDKAGEVAQQLRTYYTQLLFSRMGTMWVAWGAASMIAGGTVRALVALIPGLGWLANVAAVAAQGIVYLLLNYEPVQRFLTFTILENLVPDWINDPLYGIAKAAGSPGSVIGPYITQLKKKFMSSAPGAAADAAKAVPGMAADAAKGLAKGVGDTAKAVVSPSTAPASGMSGADLAKTL